MFRYLLEAFRARPEVSGLGRVPWNIVAVFGAALLGFAEPAIWLGALALETLYLFGLAANPRFQHWVDATRLEPAIAAPDDAVATEALAPASKARVDALKKKVARIDELYHDTQLDEFLFDPNREALQKLITTYARLLVAQKNILSNEPPTASLHDQITAITNELKAGVESSTLRESKEATLKLLTQRAQNEERRRQTLAEIASDLTRIEEQVELALEDASLRGAPAAISTNLNLVSHLFADDTSLTTESTTQAETEN